MSSRQPCQNSTFLEKNLNFWAPNFQKTRNLKMLFHLKSFNLCLILKLRFRRFQWGRSGLVPGPIGVLKLCSKVQDSSKKSVFGPLGHVNEISRNSLCDFRIKRPQIPYVRWRSVHFLDFQNFAKILGKIFWKKIKLHQIRSNTRT